MPGLNYVTLTGTIPGATGALVSASLSGWVPDPVDEQLIPPKPVPAVVGPGGVFTIRGLVANDNADIPAGSYWTITITGIPGVVPWKQNVVLNFGDGATQDLSTLAAYVPPAAVTGLMPLPVGTPVVGDAPVVLADGSPATQWTGIMLVPGGTPAAGDVPVVIADGSIATEWGNPSGGSGTFMPIAGGAFTGSVTPAVVTLTDGPSIAVNAAAGNNFRVTLAGNRTLSSPANPVDGQTIVLLIKQDATGSRLLSYGGAYAFGSAGQPTLSSTPGDVDVLAFTYDAALQLWLFTGAVTGFAGSTGWTLVGSQAVSFADGGSGHVYTLPNGAPAAGQLDVLCVNSDTTVSTPASSGAAWQVSNNHVGNQGEYLFWRIATGGESGAVTLTTAGNFASMVSWSRWTSASPPIIADVAVLANEDGTNGTSTPAVSTGTLAATGELVIAFAALHGFTATLTSPAWSTGYVPLTGDQSGTTADDVSAFTGYKTNAGTASESPSVSWSGGTATDRYMSVITFRL